MLADAILLVHAVFVLFVVGGLAAIWAGIALGQAWARNPWFRALHLAAICVVAAESLAGIVCPLTVWEDALRGRSPGAESFVGRAVRTALYWDLPESVFTALYVAFAALVAWTWWRWPPRRKRPFSPSPGPGSPRPPGRSP